ncbi:hypothetical protein H5410_001382 [Solanum commersonii]|uniref:Uncharacterized protein n=1 Tax=Solanum commersonii TaxID=4109 RepID=A0A9J6AZ15_SOLCO|nr:hypothetical protein H5410_001382 [Solanum commersonii]
MSDTTPCARQLELLSFMLDELFFVEYDMLKFPSAFIVGTTIHMEYEMLKFPTSFIVAANLYSKDRTLQCPTMDQDVRGAYKLLLAET